MSRIVASLTQLAARPLSASSPSQPADAIVVLGAPPTSGGGLSRVAAERVRVGVELWQAELAPRICIAGGPCRGAIEADVMAEHARQLGVPGSALVLERRSVSTDQNARFVAELLWPNARVWLVTQPFHMRRSMHLFRHAGLDPLAWHIDDSLQYREPRRAARWIAREYGAWAYLALRRLREASRTR